MNIDSDGEAVTLVDWETGGDAVTLADIESDGETVALVDELGESVSVEDNDSDAALTVGVAVSVGVAIRECEALSVTVEVGDADEDLGGVSVSVVEQDTDRDALGLNDAVSEEENDDDALDVGVAVGVEVGVGDCGAGIAHPLSVDLVNDVSVSHQTLLLAVSRTIPSGLPELLAKWYTRLSLGLYMNNTSPVRSMKKSRVPSEIMPSRMKLSCNAVGA